MEIKNAELVHRIRMARKRVAAAEAPGRKAAHVAGGMAAAEYERHVERLYAELNELEAERLRRARAR